MKRLLLLIGLWAAACAMLAKLSAKPAEATYVNDFAGIFPRQRADALEARLRLLADSTSNEIVVVTVGDLEGYAPADYAQRLGESWGIGDARLDNGVVILLKPRNQLGRGQVFIATGYGTEAVLTDVMAGHLIDTYMMDLLAEEKYMDAVEAVVDQIIPLMTAEWSQQGPDSPTPDNQQAPTWLWGLIVGGIVVYFLTRPTKKRKALDAIADAESIDERDERVAYARELKIRERKIEKALHRLPDRYLEKMAQSNAPGAFEDKVVNGLLLGVALEEINRLRASMQERSLRDLKQCRQRSRMDALTRRALAFGNSQDAVDRAVRIALAAIAATAAFARTSSRSGFSSHSSGGSHRSFGGGHFGGGGAGRSF